MRCSLLNRFNWLETRMAPNLLSAFIFRLRGLGRAYLGDFICRNEVCFWHNRILCLFQEHWIHSCQEIEHAIGTQLLALHLILCSFCQCGMRCNDRLQVRKDIWLGFQDWIVLDRLPNSGVISWRYCLNNSFFHSRITNTDVSLQQYYELRCSR